MGGESVMHSRKLAVMRELEDADLSLRRAREKLQRLGLGADTGGLDQIRQRLERETVRCREVMKLDRQLRRIG